MWSQLPWIKRIVLIFAAGLLLTWIATHFRLLVGTQNGFLRFALTLTFSLLILWRPKQQVGSHVCPLPNWIIVTALVMGTAGAIGGLVFGIHQIEWLGLILLVLACLELALPPVYARDAALALFLLYWAHPLPSQVFGPLQLAMQRLSVRGAEWFLHLLNVRVWADGMILRTGFTDFEVPAWCSGMRTATAVFLLVMGLGILWGLRWYECLVLQVVGLAHALFLNILRLAAMVWFTPRGAPAWALKFLHDTGGILLIAAVFLVYLELRLWERWRVRRRRRREDLPPGLIPVLSEKPPFWSALSRKKWALGSSAVGLLLIGAIVYKSRPSHRLNMLRDVAVYLREAGKLEDAQRVACIVREGFPEDQEWNMTYVRLLLLRGKCAEVLEELERLPRPKDSAPVPEREVVRAYALMGLNRLEEAAAVVEKLPEDLCHHNPRLAIILAEWGSWAKDPEKVAEYIVPAANYLPNTPRIRALYPYLRAHRKWEAIVNSDTALPYDDIVQALAAMEAYMNLNISSGVAKILIQAESAWPDDPRLLEPLFFMAVKGGPGDWEQRFSAHLARCLRTVDDVEVLFRVFDKAFELRRPDLAWALYRRIERLDPEHPALALAVAKFGAQWFDFQRRHLGFSAARPYETLDLRLFYYLANMTERWRKLCDFIPLGKELSQRDVLAVRKASLERALSEFQRRDKQGKLSLDFQYEYVKALDMAGKSEQARDLLSKIAKTYPESATANRLLLSEIYERAGDWQNVYEVLRDYLMTAAPPQPEPVLRLCRALLELRLGVAALYTAGEAVRLFPQSGQAAARLAEALIHFDSHEEALAVLLQRRPWRQREMDLLEAQALFATERYVEGETFCRAAFMFPSDNLRNQPQRLVPAPAELALLWHRAAIPSSREFSQNARTLSENLRKTTSPFLKNLVQLWLECCETGGNDASSDQTRWEACGRDRVEKAVALNQLTILLCWQERWAEARAAAVAATRWLPESPLLWRALIGLSGADPQVIREAREACPRDSEIWLAELVAATSARRTADNNGYGSEDWALDMVREATKRGTVTPGAMTRAGEYLLRMSMPRAADLAARDAVARARGLLPAYVLGVRCALLEKDKPWAVTCVKKAIEAAVRPPAFFYRKLVELKATEDPITTDSDLVEALRNLRRQEPENPLWPQILGYVTFLRGGPERIHALHEMTTSVEAGATNKIPFTVAAEAARYLGNRERAIGLLRRGLKEHPEDLALLNNLAYVLAEQESGVAEALTLVPTLLKLGGQNPQVLDTVAMVYLAAGDLEKALPISKHVAQKVSQGSSLWFRAHLVQADVALRQGRPREAEILLRTALKEGRGVSDEDLLSAQILLSRITEKLEPGRQKPALR